MRVHDGKEYSRISNSNCVQIGSGNYLPEVRQPAVFPIQPTTDDNLAVRYRYYDEEGQDEVIDQLRISWYRDGQLQPGLTNKAIISAAATIAGETWHAQIEVFDGESYSLPTDTDPVIITGAANRPPYVINPGIAPAAAGSGDDLTIDYDFIDAGGDTDNSQIYWFKWSPGMSEPQRQPQFDNEITIPASATSFGDVWYAVIVPNDGQLDGAIIKTPAVAIAQITPTDPPVAFNVQLAPGHPGPNDDLWLNYLLFNPTPELTATVRITWTRNGQEDNALADRITIPSDATVSGENWCAFVTPYTAQQTGDSIASNCVTIQSEYQNTIPVVIDASIEPSRPASSQDLILEYTFVNTDVQQSEVNTEIRWYKNRVLQPHYNGWTSVPSEDTNPGEQWYATVTPNDGISDGGLVQTPVVTINTPPTMDAPVLKPLAANIGDSLILEYTGYQDADNDPESPTSPVIKWYRDDVYLAQFGDSQWIIPAPVVTPANSVWYAMVKLSTKVFLMTKALCLPTKPQLATNGV